MKRGIAMKIIKFSGIVLIVSIIMCCISPAVMASAGNGFENAGIFATGSIRFDVQPDSFAISRTAMSMEVGETIVIKAAYTPFSANIRIGIVDSNDRFYYVTDNDGDVDVEIEISQRDEYRLAVYNLSSTLISMSGYVNY